MGSGIATALILSNYPVILKEVNDKFLQAGIGRVTGEAKIPQSLLLIISILQQKLLVGFCFQKLYGIPFNLHEKHIAIV